MPLNQLWNAEIGRACEELLSLELSVSAEADPLNLFRPRIRTLQTIALFCPFFLYKGTPA